jgi:hypothetical protein
VLFDSPGRHLTWHSLPEKEEIPGGRCGGTFVGGRMGATRREDCFYNCDRMFHLENDVGVVAGER